MTWRTVEALKPKAAPYIRWDPSTPGFGVMVHPSGRKSYVVQARIRGVSRRKVIGRHCATKIAVMRAKAHQWLFEAERRQRPIRQEPAKDPAPTLEVFAEVFLAAQTPRWAASTMKRSRKAVTVTILPTLGDLRVDEITRAHVERWFDGLGTRPGIANRALPVLSNLMKYAEAKGHRPIGSNPCRRMRCYKRPPKERYLSRTELRRLGRVLAGLEGKHPDHVDALRLLLLTGARYREVLTLRWSWIRGSRAFLPTSKTGAKTLYLCAAALEVLEGRRDKARDDLVFPAPFRQGPRWTLEKVWNDIRAAAGLEGVRIHDLRHAYASVAAGAGVNLSIVGALLGHALPETTMRYTHFADFAIREGTNRVSNTLAAALMGEGA